MQKIFIFISVIFFIACVPSSSEKEIKINPTVRFQGNWLIIKNNDTFSYDYVKTIPFEVPDTLEGGRFCFY